MAVHVGADGGELFLVLGTRRQITQRGDGGFMRAVGFGAVFGQAGAALVQCGTARGVTVDLAFGVGVLLAGGIGFALGGADGFARGALGGGRGLQFGFGVLQRLTLGDGIRAGLLDLGFDIDKTCALGETARCAGRCMGGCNEAVPAPQVAFTRLMSQFKTSRWPVLS